MTNDIQLLSQEEKRARACQQVTDALDNAWTLIPNAEAEQRKLGNSYIRYMLSFAQSKNLNQISPERIINIFPEVATHYLQQLKALHGEPYSDDDKCSAQLGLTKSRMDADEHFRCLSSYCKNQLYPKLARTDPPAIQSKTGTEEIKTALSAGLSAIYQAAIRYCQQIDITCLNYSYSCPQSLLKLPFQSRELYPALPAIFTADTIRQLFDAGSGAKIKLLQPTKVKNISNVDQDKLLQFVKWLENEITGLLATCTSTICEPMAYPSSPEGMRLFSTLLNTILHRRIPPLKMKDIPFALPMCRLHRLAEQLTVYAELSPEQHSALYDLLADAIYAPNNPAEKLAEYLDIPSVKRIAPVLDCFRQVVKLDYRRKDQESLEKRQRVVESLSKCGFFHDASVSNSSNDPVDIFLAKYFSYVDVTDILVAMKLSEYHMYMSSLMLPRFFIRMYSTIMTDLNTACDVKDDISFLFEKRSFTHEIPDTVRKNILNKVTWEKVDGILASSAGVGKANPAIKSMMFSEVYCKQIAGHDQDLFYSVNKTTVEMIQMKASDMVARRCTAVLLRAYFESYGLIAHDGK